MIMHDRTLNANCSISISKQQENCEKIASRHLTDPAVLSLNWVK